MLGGSIVDGIKLNLAIARITTRDGSRSSVGRCSISDFSIGFPNFFKLSPKMLYLGPIYPKFGGPIDAS